VLLLSMSQSWRQLHVHTQCEPELAATARAHPMQRPGLQSISVNVPSAVVEALASSVELHPKLLGMAQPQVTIDLSAGLPVKAQVAVSTRVSAAADVVFSGSENATR